MDSLACHKTTHLNTPTEQIVNYFRPLLSDGIVQSWLKCTIRVILWSAWRRRLSHILPSRDYLLNTVKAIVCNSLIQLLHQGVVWEIFDASNGQIKLVPLSEWVWGTTWSCTCHGTGASETE